MGFEPTEGCPSCAFQACRFGRSRTSPNCVPARYARYREIVPARRAPTGEVTVGSCATGARESGQARGSSLQRHRSCAADRLAVASADGASAQGATFFTLEKAATIAGTVPSRPPEVFEGLCSLRSCSSRRVHISQLAHESAHHQARKHQDFII